MSSPKPSERRRVLYSGNVQGVGFRAMVRHIAQGFMLKGFVRNLREGDVEVLVEGEEASIEVFLAQIATRMERHITGCEVTLETPTGEFRSFEITR